MVWLRTRVAQHNFFFARRKALPVHEVLRDSRIVARDEHGDVKFELPQQRRKTIVQIRAPHPPCLISYLCKLRLNCCKAVAIVVLKQMSRRVSFPTTDAVCPFYVLLSRHDVLRKAKKNKDDLGCKAKKKRLDASRSTSCGDGVDYAFAFRGTA